MTKLVLIDGNAIMHRAFHALPPLTSKEGEPIGAVYGFVTMLLRVITDLNPTHIAVAFDRKEPTFRKKMHQDYQAHRPEMDKDLDSQFINAKKVAHAFGIPVYEKVGFEADDVIGTIAKRAHVDRVIIVTGDKDILQLVDTKIRVYLPGRGLTNAVLINASGVKEKLGITPKQVVDYKALVGDPSDNYKGVPGIGPKTAEKLLTKYKTFQALYKNLAKIDDPTQNKLKQGKESGQISLKLAKIVTTVDVDFDLEAAGDWAVDRPEIIALFKNFGFKSLTTRVQKMGGSFTKKDPSPTEIKKVVKKVAQKLSGHQYAIRGTTSLKLQGYDMEVDDVDVLTDKESALACNKLLKDYLLEKVEYSKSDQYKSYFGKFVIDEVLVEVYGAWQIQRNLASNGWSEPFNATTAEITQIKLDDQNVQVTKPETELAMYAAMGRWNAYHKLRNQLEKKNQAKLF